MSLKEVLEGKVVPSSAGMILHTRLEGNLVVLVGRRKTEPWKGYASIVFAGLVQPTDESAPDAALREAQEETGGGLTIEVPHPSFVIALGPQSFHHLLKLESNWPLAVKTDRPTDPEHKFVCNVYAGYVAGGEPRETDEMGDFKWMDPIELARLQMRLAFDQALALQEFYGLWYFQGLFRKPGLANLIFSEPV